jgi:hypothetical protein
VLFLGCAVKEKPIYAVIKSDYVKIADQGFLKEGFGYKEIVIYKAGIRPVSMEIKNSVVCLNGKCMDKEKFIKNIDKSYPVNLLDNILEKKPLDFLGKITKTKYGFIQKSERFFYRVSKNSVLFKDRYEHILIMIKYLKD